MANLAESKWRRRDEAIPAPKFMWTSSLDGPLLELVEMQVRIVLILLPRGRGMAAAVWWRHVRGIEGVDCQGMTRAFIVSKR